MKRLLLFAKRPRLGKVKTRLCPPLLPEQALDLYRAFLSDQLDLVRASVREDEAELCLDGAWTPGPNDPALDGARLTSQGAGDLGARMLRAVQRCVAQGCSRTVIIGADSPTLPAALVELAFDRLAAGVPAVVAPSIDGGYVLIGLRQARRELFDGLPWGGPAVLQQTRLRAREVGLSLELIPPWYDIDDAWGLAMLRRELGQARASRRAPATARVLFRARAR